MARPSTAVPLSSDHPGRPCRDPRPVNAGGTQSAGSLPGSCGVTRTGPFTPGCPLTPLLASSSFRKVKAARVSRLRARLPQTDAHPQPRTLGATGRAPPAAPNLGSPPRAAGPPSPRAAAEGGALCAHPTPDENSVKIEREALRRAGSDRTLRLKSRALRVCAASSVWGSALRLWLSALHLRPSHCLRRSQTAKRGSELKSERSSTHPRVPTRTQRWGHAPSQRVCCPHVLRGAAPRGAGAAPPGHAAICLPLAGALRTVWEKHSLRSG